MQRHWAQESCQSSSCDNANRNVQCPYSFRMEDLKEGTLAQVSQPPRQMVCRSNVLKG